MPVDTTGSKPSRRFGMVFGPINPRPLRASAVMIDRRRSGDEPTAGWAPAAPERRLLPRRRAMTRHADLCWWEDSAFRSVPALIADVGPGGASVLVPVPPPAGVRVHLLLYRPRIRVEAVTARMAHLSADRRGHRVGLVFDVPCPPALFEAISRGFDALEAMLN
jgi:hypothetical protein